MVKFTEGGGSGAKFIPIPNKADSLDTTKGNVRGDSLPSLKKKDGTNSTVVLVKKLGIYMTDHGEIMAKGDYTVSETSWIFQVLKPYRNKLLWIPGGYSLSQTMEIGLKLQFMRGVRLSITLLVQ